VQFTIYIIDLRPDEIHAMHLESVDILRREVVNLAQDRESKFYLSSQLPAEFDTT
jgi:hypothetical protein